MNVYKFGGASVKDAGGIKNLINVLNQVGYSQTVVVLSAMGKTTNALEVVLDNYFNKKNELQSSIQEVKKFHNAILIDLFENENHPVFISVKNFFKDLNIFLDRNKSPDYSYVYDQVIGFGELISSTIVSMYLNDKGLTNVWMDVRDLIKTNSYYRNAQVNWEITQQNLNKAINKGQLTITQGFLGSDHNNFTTTLGREGSDYTAAIIAYCINSESVTIWKDVPGILNADPRYFENAQLLNHISYHEAIELAFYGASVIHPKTLQPLQRKEIPLFVKSFMHPKNPGTSIGRGKDLEPLVPCFIVKKNLVLISLSTLDFSFIVEENISKIFNLLAKNKMKVHLIQNSAISFSVCMINHYNNLDKLVLQLKAKFKVSVTKSVSLYTIRHITKQSITSLEKNKTVLLKQTFGETVQLVTQ